MRIVLALIFITSDTLLLTSKNKAPLEFSPL